MRLEKIFVLLIFALALFSGQTAEASSVKIWDTIVRDTDHKFYKFEDSYAWTNKNNWVQVPYGTSNYNFIGDQVIENGNFWFYLHDSGFDSPFMYANMSGTPVSAGEMYIKSTVDGKQKFNFYKKSVVITKNTPEELVLMVDSGYIAGINVIQYTIKKDSFYIEAKAMTDHKYEAGFHCAPNRFAVAPIKNGVGNDFVIDPTNYSDIPDKRHIFFYPDEQHGNMMIQEIRNGGWFFQNMIIYEDWTFAQPFIEISKDPGMRLDSIRAYMQPGQSNQRVYFGLINQEDIFLEESPNKAITAGSTYTSNHNPEIPGRWRVSGRVKALNGSEHYYTQDVYDQNFVFVSPVSGTLEALALYLYDRTSETPSDITTPMDVYRDITGQTTKLPKPTFSKTAGTLENSQSISISTSATGATIRYTTDGTAPTETSSIYSTPIAISSTTTIKARAWKTGFTPSDMATATYTIGTISQAQVLSLILNPGFESGTTQWRFYTSGTGSFLATSPGYESSNAARLDLNSGGSNIQLYQAGLTLEPNTCYQLSFEAYSTTGNDVTVRMFKHGLPYTAYAPDFTANLGTNWQTFITEFTTSGFTGTVNDGRLQFWFTPFAAYGDTYYIDNVKLEKVSAIELPVILTHPADQTVTAGQTATFSVVASATAPLTYQWQKNGMNITGATYPSYTTPATILSDNGSTYCVLVRNPSGSTMSNTATCTITIQAPVRSLIINPGFESGTTSWKFYTSGTGTLSTVSPGYEGSSAARLDLSSGGSNIQLYQTGITLEPDTRYRLSFAAYSTTGHDMTVRLFKHVPPYTAYAPDFTADLGTNWQTFTTEFTTSGLTSIVDDGRLQFWLAPFALSQDNYYIDCIGLEIINGSDTTLPEVMENGPEGTNILVTAQINFTFSETMDQASVESAFTTSPATVGSFNWNDDTVTYTPSSDMAFDTTYTVTIGTGAMDLAGNKLELPYNWEFTTESEKIPPTITGNTPTGTNVLTNSQITVTFSETMDQTSVESAFTTSPTTVGSFSWNDDTLTYTLGSDMAFDTTYTVTMGTGAMDLAGNKLELPYNWEFTTEVAQTSENLIQNPDFESGTAPWKFYTNGMGKFLSDVSGEGDSYAGHILITRKGDNVQLYQPDMELEPNTQYRLSFKAYSDTGHDLSISLHKHISPYTDYGLSDYEVDIGNSWSEYSILFITSGFSETINDGRLKFWLAPYNANGDQYFIDDVILEKA